MKILVTGHVSHMTKQVIKQLHEAGHQVRLVASEHVQAMSPDAAWLINGLAALPLNEPGRGYGPLQMTLKELIPTAQYPVG